MPERTKTRRIKTDAFLADAVNVALDAAVDVARVGAVGEHSSFEMLDERLGIHYFSSTEPGYVGWRWGVTVARVPRGRKVTVCEVDLVPGEGSLLAPEWIPWEDRLLPGDVSRDDILPYRAEDARLDQGYEATGLDADELLTHEMGLGRPRVLSARGRADAIKRWYNSEQGPKPGRLPKSTCSTCGFLLKMSGSMRTVFGVCANAWSADDGRVVSLDHSCGSHSETDVPRRESEWPVRPSRVNDFQVESAPMPTETDIAAAQVEHEDTNPVEEAQPQKSQRGNTPRKDTPEPATSSEKAVSDEQALQAAALEEEHLDERQTKGDQSQNSQLSEIRTDITTEAETAGDAVLEPEQAEEESSTKRTSRRTRTRVPRQSALRTRRMHRSTHRKN